MVTIAFVHNRFPAGGAERITIDIARYLRSIGGYRVYVYATRVNQMLMTEELDEILTIRHIPSQAIQTRRSAAVEKLIEIEGARVSWHVTENLSGSVMSLRTGGRRD